MIWKRLMLMILFGTIFTYAAESSVNSDVGKINLLWYKLYHITHIIWVISYYFQLTVHIPVPTFTESIMTGCSISVYNNSLIYQTAIPYQNNSECEAEFNCPNFEIHNTVHIFKSPTRLEMINTNCQSS